MKSHEVFGLSIYDNNSGGYINYNDGIITIDIERGQQEYTGPFTFPDPGTATIVSRNPSLDPYTNPLIRYNTKIVIRLSTTRVFTGYIEGINVEYQPGDKPPIITIKAIDMIGVLGKHVLSEDFITQRVSWTTQQLLEALPDEVNDFEPVGIFTDGLEYADAPIEIGTTALDALRDRVKTDFGMFYMGRAGVGVYFRYDKDDPLHPYNLYEPSIYFNYDGSQTSYKSVNLNDGFTRVVNDLELNGTDNTDVFVSSSGSINAWGKSSASVKLMTDNNVDIQTIADIALNELAQPQRELQQITFDGFKAMATPTLPVAAVLNYYRNNININHRIDANTVLNRKYQIVGIKYAINYNDFDVTLTLRNVAYQSEEVSNPIIVRTPEQGTQLTEFTYSFIYPDLSEITAISWDADDGFTGTDPTITVDYVTGGTKTVTLTIDTIYGYSKTVTVLFFVGDSIPTSSFTYTSNADNIYTFTFTGAGATSVLWQFGDGTQSTEFNPTKYYLNTATVTVSCVATNYVGSATSSQSIGVTKIAVIPVKYIRLSFVKPLNQQWNDDDSYRLATIYPNTGGQRMYGISAFELKNTIPDPDVVIQSPYTLLDYKEYGGCMVRGPIKDNYGRIERLTKNDVMAALMPNVTGVCYPYAINDMPSKELIEMTFQLDDFYTNINAANFVQTAGSSWGTNYAVVEVSYDNVNYYNWGAALFNGANIDYTDPLITRPNWNLPLSPSNTPPKGVRFIKASTQFVSGGSTPDYKINEFFALTPGLRVNNGSFTYLSFPPQDNTITDCVGLGGIDLERNSGASYRYEGLPASSTRIYYYQRTATNRNFPQGSVGVNNPLTNINLKNMKDWIRWDDGSSAEVNVVMDLGQVRYDISGVYIDWRQDNDLCYLPVSNPSSTSLATTNVIDLAWSDDGVTWYPMVTNEPMLRTPNNGAFITKTTPVYVSGSSGPTWSPPITSGSTFTVDSMNATTNPPLKYVFP